MLEVWSKWYALPSDAVDTLVDMHKVHVCFLKILRCKPCLERSLVQEELRVAAAPKTTISVAEPNSRAPYKPASKSPQPRRADRALYAK